jgi:microcompartment protein CcmK/EutM
VTLCRVVASVVGTHHHPVLDGRTILACAPVNPKTGETLSAPEILAIDTVQAGLGDYVLVCDEGNAARLVLQEPSAPARSLIVAVVDQYGVE